MTTTTKAAHTAAELPPSPWSVDPDEREDMDWNSHILDAAGNTVCFMAWSGDRGDNEAHENAARLIAAAPELLEHAQAAVEGIREAVRVMDLMGRGQAARDLAIHQINLSHAIRKATGGA